ncbi:uncharacterized protein LOC122706419 [Cervus elaphus]|uniref:uncharacterized protein LOC122706419 n=1 Tax=Cervus elaphus TaxID=9860 RepID=UPI001CC31D68|nr:uncharacterized protein LOC122706419 [Cervus elaphus]
MIMVIQVSLAFGKVCVREKASSVYYPLGSQVTTWLKKKPLTKTDSMCLPLTGVVPRVPEISKVTSKLLGRPPKTLSAAVVLSDPAGQDGAAPSVWGQDDSQEWLLLGAAEKREVWEESPSSLACSGFSSWVPMLLTGHRAAVPAMHRVTKEVVQGEALGRRNGEAVVLRRAGLAWCLPGMRGAGKCLPPCPHQGWPAGCVWPPVFPGPDTVADTQCCHVWRGYLEMPKTFFHQPENEANDRGWRNIKCTLALSTIRLRAFSFLDPQMSRAQLPAQFPLAERTSDPHLETSWTLLGLSSQWLAVVGKTHFYFDGMEGVRPGNQTGHKSQLHHSPTV